MKQIRQGLFETNSSSTHSISIPRHATVDFPELPKIIEVPEEYFGWEKEAYNDWRSKLSYLIAAINSLGFVNATKPDLDKIKKDYIKKIEEYLKGLGVEKITYSELSSVDHGDKCREFVQFVLFTSSRLFRYLFSEESIIETGNDNSEDDEDRVYEVLNSEEYDYFYKGN